ncbi:MAG: flippase [Anaerolineaceae bacterium]|nr:flippase [Anaerolineaceae bacterium]
MNLPRKLFSNFTLSFASQLISKISDVLLFIIVARTMSVEDAGAFRLAKSFMAVTLALSAFGLQDLLIRELAPRRNEGKKYLINYVLVRAVTATCAYGLLLLLLSTNIPYSTETKSIIRIFSLALLPEAIFSICEAFFTAYDRLWPPTVAGSVGGFVKLVGGLWILFHYNSLITLTLIIPVGSSIGLLTLLPSFWKLFKEVRQDYTLQLDWSFIIQQINQISGFILIGVFFNLNDQQDTFLVSILLSETELAWYGAAQTVVFGFSLLSAAIRTAVYPTMSHYYYESPEKLVPFYQHIARYSIIFIMPLTTLVTLFARNIIVFIYQEPFGPASVPLRWMIWEVFFLILHIPTARLMLVQGKQKQLGWITGIGLLINVSANLIVIPRFGIEGAALIRPIVASINYILGYLYIRSLGIEINIISLFPRPLLALGAMVMVAILFENSFLFPFFISILVYVIVLYFLGELNHKDLNYLLQLLSKN